MGTVVSLVVIAVLISQILVLKLRLKLNENLTKINSKKYELLQEINYLYKRTIIEIDRINKE